MTLAMAGFQARAVLRGRWSIAAVLAFAVASGLVAVLGLGSFRQLGLGAVGPAAVSFLNLALLLPTAQALLLGALVLSGERESGFLATLRARGMGPGTAVLATWVGVALSAWLSLAAGFAVVALVVAGNVPTADLPVFIGILLVCGACAAVAAAVGCLVGVALRDRLQAALAAIGAWFIMAIALDLVVVGLGVFLSLGEAAILAAVLANPIEAARIAALLMLDASGAALGPVGVYLVGAAGEAMALGALLGSLLAWVVAPLGLAAWTLSRRDL